MRAVGPGLATRQAAPAERYSPSRFGSNDGRAVQGGAGLRQAKQSRTVRRVPIAVYDFRHNLANLVVEPQIRTRFRRVELGPVPAVHSHDLGAETFVVMQGQIEFTVNGESVVCTAGQAIVVPPRTTHAVRAVGEQPAVMYLSVSPHVEPTHTFYDANGQRLPPRYGVWREAGQGDSLGQTGARTSDAEALQSYRAAASRLADVARASAEQAARTATVDKAAIDELWMALRPVLEQVESVERTWNALALFAAE